MSGEAESADVKAAEVLEPLDKLIVKEITCQSKYSMHMKLPILETDA